MILQCDDGVPTGMSTGVILANVYLDDFDEHVNNSLNIHSASYDRLVDDVCVADDMDDEVVLSIFNSWHPSIQFEQSGKKV